jgi:hypothetical protein
MELHGGGAGEFPDARLVAGALVEAAREGSDTVCI